MKYKLPWITSEIKRHKRERSIAQESSSLSETIPLGGVQETREHHLVSKLVRKSPSDYLNNVIGASLQENPKKCFGLMSDLVNQRPFVYPLCDMVIAYSLLTKVNPRHLMNECE